MFSLSVPLIKKALSLQLWERKQGIMVKVKITPLLAVIKGSYSTCTKCSLSGPKFQTKEMLQAYSSLAFVLAPEYYKEQETLLIHYFCPSSNA